ncbi:MAG: NAD(P)H-dependent oxidoreductase [Alphaproteobacteria bacterium]|nr:NAD(P)H-dependent oxidoreductase [Alphaproteobacteria bacterium]
MAESVRVATIVGSLRRESFSRKVANALAALAPDRLMLEVVEIGNLPLYDQDLDEGAPPPAWSRFRDEVRACGAVLFVTPEYNRSVPGLLKNAIDVGSRPYGHSVWARKPAAVVSVTPGALGGFGANHHLRQSAVFLDMPMMQQPEAYLAGVGTWFGEDGSLQDEKVRPFLADFMRAFADWCGKLAAVSGAAA